MEKQCIIELEGGGGEGMQDAKEGGCIITREEERWNPPSKGLQNHYHRIIINCIDKSSPLTPTHTET